MKYLDTKLSDGRDIQFEYSYIPGSPTTYSPAFGAEGGDGPEVDIKSVMYDGKMAVDITDEDMERLISECLAASEGDNDDSDMEDFLTGGS